MRYENDYSSDLQEIGMDKHEVRNVKPMGSPSPTSQSHSQSAETTFLLASPLPSGTNENQEKCHNNYKNMKY